MLTELSVQALGVIDRAEISLAGGSSALTGETGAGKTLLVAAMGLLLGGRADRTLVREQASEALVEGRFVLPGDHPATLGLIDNGIIGPAEGDVEIVVSRVVSADGRGKARVNGRLVPLSLLTEIGPRLVEIAGQHEHHRLGSPTYQRALLDSYCGPETAALATDVRRLVKEAIAARREVDRLREGLRERERELDVLRYEANEIATVEPSVGESERLQEEARRLEHAETIALGLESAAGALNGEGGAVDRLAAAIDSLRGAAEVDPALADLAARLDAASIEITDVAGELATRVVVPDPEQLEATRERVDALARLRRKYGEDDAEVLEYLDRARSRIAALEEIDEGLDRREDEARAREEHAAALAKELHQRRIEASPRLEKALIDSLAELSLPDARVEIGIEQVELHEGGIDEVNFLVSLNRGEGVRPLAKVASGGELSRLSLALGLLTTTGTARTMVFDEVDAGVGGATAHSIGRALTGLARNSGVQVLVVTHLPQVAAFADHQFRIRKSTDGDRTSSLIEHVSEEARVDELSRMLAGMPESERAREHAQELLEMAGEARR
jgi:DNA repair protein RecN (Recombination protein N)